MKRWKKVLVCCVAAFVVGFVIGTIQKNVAEPQTQPSQPDKKEFVTSLPREWPTESEEHQISSVDSIIQLARDYSEWYYSLGHGFIPGKEGWNGQRHEQEGAILKYKIRQIKDFKGLVRVTDVENGMVTMSYDFMPVGISTGGPIYSYLGNTGITSMPLSWQIRMVIAGPLIIKKGDLLDIGGDIASLEFDMPDDNQSVHEDMIVKIRLTNVVQY